MFQGARCRTGAIPPAARGRDPEASLSTRIAVASPLVLMALAALLLPRPALASVEAGPIANPANGHEYYLLAGAAWADAEAEAIALGGHLVTVDDAGENDWVWETFQAIRPGPFWIGLNDALQEGTYEWANGAPTSYTNWWVGGGEPNDAGAGEDAAEIHNYVWNDRDAAVALPAIVERAPVTPRIIRVDWSAEVSGAHGPGTLAGTFGEFEVSGLGQVFPLPPGAALEATASGFSGNFADGVYALDQSSGGLSIRFDAVEPLVSTTLVGDAGVAYPVRYGWSVPCGGSNRCRVILKRDVAAGFDLVQAGSGVIQDGSFIEYYSSGEPQYTYTVPEPEHGGGLLAVAALGACYTRSRRIRRRCHCRRW